MGRTVFAAMVIGGLVLSSICFGYSGGSGTPGEPYQIATKADLLDLAATTTDYSKYFILTADIDMVGQVFTTAIIAMDTSSSSGFQGTAFTGTFDGDGHNITNFTIDGGSNDYLGLFGKIDTGGSVKNLGLDDFAVSGSSGSQYFYVGGLVGDNHGSSISNCHSMGDVNGYDGVGGLVGMNSNGSISGCYSTGAVSGTWMVGGLVGGYFGNISNCYSTGSVSGSSGSLAVGGLVGWHVNGSISGCYSTGVVSGGAASSTLGGLVGQNFYGSISNCYSTGAVSGSDKVGGLVGGSSHGSISNCYSTGAVNGTSNVGGLVGYKDSGTATNSFWDTETSGQTTSAGGTGKTTVEMKILSTFTSALWDFLGETDNGTDDIWRMCADGVNYPKLNWESIAGDFACPDGVYFEDLAYFLEWWLMTDCGLNNDCDGTDMNTDGAVNFIDFVVFASHWLEM